MLASCGDEREWLSGEWWAWLVELGSSSLPGLAGGEMARATRMRLSFHHWFWSRNKNIYLLRPSTYANTISYKVRATKEVKESFKRCLNFIVKHLREEFIFEKALYK